MTGQMPLRPITREEADLFERDGFVTLRGVLSPDWLMPLASAVERVLASDHVRDATAEGPGEARGERGQFYVSFNTARREPALLDFALRGALGHIAAAILGSPTARLCDDLLLVKEPGCVQETEWHDDEPYSIATGTQRCSIWVALDDVPEQGGALRYLKGSHRRFAGWRGRVDAAALALEHSGDIVICPVRRGDVVLHHPATIHSATPNSSSQRRRAFAPRFAGASARFILPPVRREPREWYGLEDGEPLGGLRFPLAWPPARLEEGTGMSGAPYHARINRTLWERSCNRYQQKHGGTLDSGPDAWGSWRIPEAELGVLGDVCGKDVLELGCGAAHWSIELAGRGARPVGLDITRGQLAHARRLISISGCRVPILQANAEFLPFRNESFDIAFSDFGAMTFADPERTVPEAARVLRPGGLLAFCTDNPLLYVCWPDGQEHVGDRLQLNYFTLRRFGENLVEFPLPYGAWIRLFRRHGFVVEDLIEPCPPADAASSFRSQTELEWARQWPSEIIWKARKARGDR